MSQGCCAGATRDTKPCSVPPAQFLWDGIFLTLKNIELFLSSTAARQHQSHQLSSPSHPVPSCCPGEEKTSLVFQMFCWMGSSHKTCSLLDSKQSCVSLGTVRGGSATRDQGLARGSAPSAPRAGFPHWGAPWRPGLESWIPQRRGHLSRWVSVLPLPPGSGGTGIWWPGKV